MFSVLDEDEVSKISHLCIFVFCLFASLGFAQTSFFLLNKSVFNFSPILPMLCPAAL